jgi:hypothetical protein
MTIASVWSALEANVAACTDAIRIQCRGVVGRGYAPKRMLLLQPLQARSLWKRSGGNLLHKLLTEIEYASTGNRASENFMES